MNAAIRFKRSANKHLYAAGLVSGMAVLTGCLLAVAAPDARPLAAIAVSALILGPVLLIIPTGDWVLYLLLIASVPFGTALRLPGLTNTIAPLLGGLACVAFLLRRLPFERRTRLSLDAKPALTLLGLTGASVFASTRFVVSAQGWLTYVQLVMLFVLTQALIDSPARLLTVLRVISLSLAVVALTTLIAWRSGTAEVLVARQGAATLIRLSSAFQDPNVLALILSMGVPFSAIMFLESGVAFPVRLVFGGCFLLLVAAISLTQSVGGVLGWLTAFAVSVLVRGFQRGLRIIAVFLMIGSLLFVVFLAPFILERIRFDIAENARLSGGDASLYGLGSGRVGIWLGAISQIVRKPLFGWGIGVDVVSQTPVWNIDMGLSQWGLRSAHNAILGVAVESGVPAALVFFLICGRSFCALVRSPGERRSASVEEPQAALLADRCRAVLLGMFAGQSLQLLLLNEQRAKYYWLLLALCLVYGRLMAPEANPTLAEVSRL